MWRQGWWVIACALAAACGEDTTTEYDGSTSGSGGSTGAGGADPCAVLCTVQDCIHVPCGQLCVQTGELPPGCQGHMDAFVQCVNDQFLSCTILPSACESLEYDVRACSSPTSCVRGGPGQLDANGSCSCGSVTSGAHYEIDCTSDAMGVITCECTVDDMVLGSCTEDAAQEACRGVGGCCWEELFN